MYIFLKTTKTLFLIGLKRVFRFYLTTFSQKSEIKNRLLYPF